MNSVCAFHRIFIVLYKVKFIVKDKNESEQWIWFYIALFLKGNEGGVNL